MNEPTYTAGAVRDALARHRRALAEVLDDANDRERPALIAAMSSIDGARAQLAEAIREQD